MNNLRRWLFVLVCLALALAGTAMATGLLASRSALAGGTVSGTVFNQGGAVAGATVRVRATENVTYTDGEGRFTLTSLAEGVQVEVAAWYDGYYITSTHVTPTVDGISLTLRPYHTADNPDYEWKSPIPGTSDGACGNCHPMIIGEWSANAHGSAVSNARFYSLYNGKNLSDTTSVGPGYLNDFPGTAGSCANCHAPGAGLDGYLTTDMNSVRDQLTAGIHCDYCHKTGGVYLNPATGSVYPNAPGAQSQRILRPPAGDNIFFGPFDDIKDPDTYLPLISQSQYCAPCHQFSFWGTPIYESFEEWLASPYAEAGVTCQNCHMPPNGEEYFARPEVGGLAHPPDSIPSHMQIGAADPQLLGNTVTLTMTARQHASRLSLSVTITNTGAGHHVPTDYPGRQMILLVSAVDQAGRDVPMLDGPTIPAWGGMQAGLPGVAYAKVLRDLATGQKPVVSYWKQTLIEGDNRIPALASSRSTYVFQTPQDGGQIHIQAVLLFRRVFHDIALSKGWDMPDITMAERELTISPSPFDATYLPSVTR